MLRSAGVEGSRLQVLDMGDIYLGALSLEVLLIFLLLILLLLLRTYHQSPTCSC